jgi:mannan endo-1,4-beta-mannosidase
MARLAGAALMDARPDLTEFGARLAVARIAKTFKLSRPARKLGAESLAEFGRRSIVSIRTEPRFPSDSRVVATLLFAVAAATATSACSSEPGSGTPPDGNGSGTGGSASAGTSGGSNSSGASSGGAVGAGGSGSVTGGASTVGGASASGGLPTSGGMSSSGAAGTPSPSTGGSAGNAGTGGTPAGGAATGGAGGASTTSEHLPGVVIRDAAKGTASCVPLCRVNVDPALDPEKDDWSFESGQSCVIPTTPTSKNQSCTTNEPLPPAPSVPGVVVVDSGTTRCAPLCTITTNVANDPDGDGWSYENSTSCVIPGTPTASNQACKTGEPIPPPEPRPGVLINIDADPDAECVPLCKVVTTPSDPKAPDWGYENNASCLLPASTSAMGKMPCTFNAEPPVYKPPALTGTKVKDGFYTENGKLNDAYGNAFVMRGVNNAHIYFDTSARYLAWQALDNIATYKTNTIRVVWDTTGTAALLSEVLYRVVELKMVPIVELHDVTGNQDANRLLDMAKYYTKADVKQVLTDFRAYLLINIANEWSGTSNYASAYQAAIKQLRDNGINHTLVIDASGYGQDASSIFNNATTLTNADSQKNLLFSVHMYGQYGSAAAVDAVLAQAQSSAVPLIVGEFGHQLGGAPVAWQDILAKCQTRNIGYIAWSWMGNDSMNMQLDMAAAWEGPLTSWGQNVLTGSNGIQQTAKKASIFN